MYSIFDEFDTAKIEQAGNEFPAVKRYTQILKNTNEENFKIRRLNEWLRVSLHTYYNSEDQKHLLMRWSQFVEKEVSDFFSNQDSDDLSIYALGKLGAMELNLSSDIDVIFIGDNNAKNSRIAKDFIEEFNKLDKFSFFTRVDVDIRPGGNHSPLIQNTNQISNYYFYHGETWERLALMRLSKLYGDHKTEKEISQLRQKFCFRKHIDFNAFDEFSQLRTKIHKEVKRKRKDDQIDIKLFPGCIRDIELFTHTLCVLHGGRNAELNLKGTEEALSKLSELKIVPTETVVFLIQYYWDLRRLENLIQSKEDAQIHSCKQDDPLIKRVFGSHDEFKKKQDHCNNIVSDFLKIHDQEKSLLPNTMEEQKKLLIELGFNKNAIDLYWEPIISTTARSRFSEKDEDIRKEVILNFLQSISVNAEDKDLALQVLGDFFKAVRAKASLFRFFQVHPEVIKNLSHLFGLSPFLSSKICNRPEIIDNFVYRAQASPPADLENLLEFLADHKQLGQILYSLDYVKEKNIISFTNNISELANYITRALLAKCCGDPKLDILKLGKWGGNELGLHSDLDFVFVYRSAHVPEAVHKSIRKFLSYIQATYRAGSLYGIDLRLRPSGNSGPLLVSSDRMKNYLSTKAKAWEKQAYLKASYLNSENDSLRDELFKNKINSTEIQELTEIREKLLKENAPPKTQLDIKYSPGGLVETELFAQQKILELGKKPNACSNFGLLEFLVKQDSKYIELLQNYTQLRSLEQSLPIFRQRSDTRIDIEKDQAAHKSFKFMDGVSNNEELVKLLEKNHNSIFKLNS